MEITQGKASTQGNWGKAEGTEWEGESCGDTSPTNPYLLSAPGYCLALSFVRDVRGAVYLRVSLPRLSKEGFPSGSMAEGLGRQDNPSGLKLSLLCIRLTLEDLAS